MKEYIFERTTGEFLREQEMHLDPLESEKQGKEVYLLSAAGTVTPPPEAQTGYAAVWNGKAWEQIEDHRGETVWKSYAESMTIKELGPVPDGWTAEQPEQPAGPEVKVFTKLAIRRACRKLGLEEKLDNLLNSNATFKSDWTDAQEIDLNDPYTAEAMKAFTEEEYQAILAELKP